MRTALIIPTVALLWSCAMAPTDPSAYGVQIISDLDAGQDSAAQEAFDRFADDDQFRETLYPVLFGEARSRYLDGDYEGAARVLRFTADRYPKAVAVREALLYSLFLLRADLAQPDSSLSHEMDTILAALDELGGDAAPWADLVATQNAIDLGQLEAAKAPYERFRAAWDGQPADLEPYVEDLGRYLQSPPDQAKEMNS